MLIQENVSQNIVREMAAILSSGVWFSEQFHMVHNDVVFHVMMTNAMKCFPCHKV